MKTLFVTTATVIISAMTLVGATHAENQTFGNPKVGAQRLDLCLNWGTGKGFTTSAGHVVANNIGASTPTRLLTTGAVCDQDYCDGFAQVTCFKPGAPSPQQAYVKPKFNGMRLDLCVDWGVGCGLPAAKKYCESKGWTKVKNFVVANNIGASSPTRLIGTGAVCDQDFCDGFKVIICKN
jgi:hypothetical protein